MYWRMLSDLCWCCRLYKFLIMKVPLAPNRLLVTSFPICYIGLICHYVCIEVQPCILAKCPFWDIGSENPFNIYIYIWLQDFVCVHVCISISIFIYRYRYRYLYKGQKSISISPQFNQCMTEVAPIFSSSPCNSFMLCACSMVWCLSCIYKDRESRSVREIEKEVQTELDRNKRETDNDLKFIGIDSSS